MRLYTAEKVRTSFKCLPHTYLVNFPHAKGLQLYNGITDPDKKYIRVSPHDGEHAFAGFNKISSKLLKKFVLQMYFAKLKSHITTE